MGKKLWTKEKLDVLKMYLETGASYREISDKLGASPDSIEKTVRRYNLRAGMDNTLVLPKDKSKLKKDDITKLAKLIGQNIYENYR
ncbi:MAG TPA: helix-turn-helix domain-containing protein, partial [Candidatus Paceibacterota bacterium]|nr:helix-turn-helix domain-containing protein [Candidatus Paceibacterota bacterium]